MLKLIRNALPADAQLMRTWAYSQIKYWTQGNNPFEPEELALLRAERAKNEHPYGDMTLVVITRGLSEDGGPDSKEALAELAEGTRRSRDCRATDN